MPNSEETTVVSRLYLAGLSVSLILVIFSILGTSLSYVQDTDDEGPKHFMEYFDFFDKDRKGELTESDVKKALGALGLDWNEQKKVRLVAACGGNAVYAGREC